MRNIPAKQARLDFTTLMNQVAFKGERIAITRNGKEQMYCISKEDMELFEKLEDEADLKAAKRAQARVKKRGAISWEEMEKRLDIND